MLLLAMACGRAPAPGASGTILLDSLQGPFNGERILADVTVLAHDSMEGRAIGTPGGARARRWIVTQFASAGLVPPAGGYEQDFDRDGQQGTNVVGLVPGGDPSGGVILLLAHYDHLGIRGGQVYNGADDNASGVAVALAIARRLVATPLASSVMVAALDGEEQGLLGARALLAGLPDAGSDVRLVLNLDMVGRNDAHELWVVGTRYSPGLRPLVDSLARETPLLIRQGHDGSDLPGRDDWTGASDHGPFHEAGIPFLYLGVEDHADYHRPTDDVERIEAGMLGAAAEFAWRLLVGTGQR